ncbi:MAG: leucine-rich repeat domain-containing protein, partial [Promethearchaeota archaeon]
MNDFKLELLEGLSEKELKIKIKEEAQDIVRELFKLLNSNFQGNSNGVSNLFHKMNQISHDSLEPALVSFLKQGFQLDHMFKLGIIEYISSEGLNQALNDSDSKLFDSIISYLLHYRTPFHISRLFYRIRGFTPITNKSVSQAVIKYFNRVGIDLFFQTKIFERILQKEEFIDLIESEEVDFINKFIKFVGGSYEYLRDYENFFSWMTYEAPEIFFEKLRHAAPNYLEGKILNDLKKVDVNRLIYILNYQLIRFVRLEQIVSLLSATDSKFFNYFLTTIKKLIGQSNYTISSLSNYFYSLGKFFNDSLKQKVIHLIENGDSEDLNMIITLRWIECLSIEEIKALFDNPSIKLGEKLESLLKDMLSNAYYDEYIDLTSLASLFYKIHTHFDDQFIRKIMDASDYVGENELREDFLYFLAESISKAKKEDAKPLIKLLKLVDSEGNFQFVSYQDKKYIASNNNLNLEKKGIEDIDQIEGLSKLQNLTSLNLSGNKISKIKGLENLTKLTRLSLNNNNIEKISGLNNLENLTYLSLSQNRINEIEGLERLTNLRELWLNNNSISEIKGFENLQNLRTLELYSNKITELRGLDSLKKLWRISISENKLEELKGLDSLSNLHTLYLGNNNFSEIKGLQNLTNLESLDLSDSQIKKIEGLDTLTNLKYLNLRGNNISEIENLQNLVNLEDIRLAANNISKLKGLDALRRLKTISIGKNMIPGDIIRQLGGYSSYEEGFVKNAQNFVNYSREIREKEELSKFKKARILQEFEVNEYLTLKLEGNAPKVYINEELVEYPLRGNFTNICSEFQEWSENDYQFHILDRRLTLLLLKKLIEAGDSLAKRSLKNFILKKMDTGNVNEICNLIFDRYLDYLDFKDLEDYSDYPPLLNSLNILLEKEFLNIYMRALREHGMQFQFLRKNEKAFPVAFTLHRLMEKASDLLKKILINIISRASYG